MDILTKNDLHLKVSGIKFSDIISIRTTEGSFKGKQGIDFTGATLGQLIEWSFRNRMVALAKVTEKNNKKYLFDECFDKYLNVLTISSKQLTDEEVKASVSTMSKSGKAELLAALQAELENEAADDENENN